MMKLMSALNPNYTNGICNVTNYIGIKYLAYAIQLGEKLYIFKQYGKYVQVTTNQIHAQIFNEFDIEIVCCQFRNISKYFYFKFKSDIYCQIANVLITQSYEIIYKCRY